MMALSEQPKNKDLLSRYDKISRIINPDRFIDDSNIISKSHGAIQPIIEETGEHEGEILSEEIEEAIRINREKMSAQRPSSSNPTPKRNSFRKRRKLDIMGICRLINEKNTAYAGIYLNNIPKYSLMQIFDEIF